MSFYDTEARVSKDPIVGLVQMAAGDNSPEKLTAIIGSAMDDNGKLIVPQAVTETAKEISDSGINMSYSPSTGLPGLAELLSEEIIGSDTCAALKSSGVNRAEVITSAGTNAIATTLLVATSAEDQIITHNPHWAGYDSIALGIKRKPLKSFDILDSEDNFNFEAFEKTLESLDKNSKIILIMNTPFDNPLGKDFGLEAWDRIAQILAKYNDREILFILDTAYVDFGPEGKDYSRLSFLPELFQTINSPNFNLVIAGTVSKSFAMYGARVGVACLLSTNEENTKNWKDVAGGTTRGSISQMARTGQEIVDKILKDKNKLANVHQFQKDTAALLKKRREFFIASLDGKLPKEFKVIKPDSGFFTTIKIDKSVAETFYQKMIETHLYAPLISGQFLRIPVCGLSEKKLGQVAERLIKLATENLAVK